MSYGDGRVKTYRRRDGTERFLALVPDGRGGERPCGIRDTFEAADALRAAGLEERESIPLGDTLAEYGRRWLARIAPHQRNARSWLSSWECHVAPTELGRTLVGEVARADIRDWLRELAVKKGQRGALLSWQSRKHALGLVRRCLAEAVEDELQVANPAAEIKMGKRPKTGKEWTFLEPVELSAVLALELEPQPFAAIEWSAHLGLRQGELAALQRRDVDIAAGIVRVSRSWDRTATKNGDAREVSIIPEARAAIDRWLAQLELGPEDLVFGNPAGEMWARGYDWGWGDRRCHGGKSIPERAGIKRRVTWHALRHTHASWLVSGYYSVGAWSLELVRDQLGHSSVEETERYAHLSPERRAKASRARGQSGMNPESKERELRQMLERIELQLAEMKAESSGRAVGDSNSRPSAPEALVSLCDPAALAALFQVDSGFEASRLIEAVRAGETVAELDAERLALAAIAQAPGVAAALAYLTARTGAALVALVTDLDAGAAAQRRAR